MKDEIDRAVKFIVSKIDSSKCHFYEDQIESFQQHLIENLTKRFEDIWDSNRFHGFRILRLQRRLDKSVSEACVLAGIEPMTLCNSLKNKFTLHIHPNHVFSLDEKLKKTDIYVY